MPNTTTNYPKKLLQPGDGNTKLRKNRGYGYRTVGLSMAPHKTAGIGNVCAHASPGCAAACLDHQGLASVFSTIREARIRKTQYYYDDRQAFLEQLETELAAAEKNARAAGFRLAARLNVFSDIAWEDTGIIDRFRTVQFYDYTKNPRRAGLVRPNYWITLSRSETNERDCIYALRNACNVAVVFSNGDYVGNRSGMQSLPRMWQGFEVIDGDNSDMRFSDIRGRKVGRVVGLRLKTHSYQERAVAIASGFAVPV